MGEATVWERSDHAQALGKEKSELNRVVSAIDQLRSGISDTQELFLLAQESISSFFKIFHNFILYILMFLALSATIDVVLKFEHPRKIRLHKFST